MDEEDIELTKEIDNSKNYLSIAIRLIVNDFLFIYNQKYGLEIDYNVRNEIFLYAYKIIIKKYINNSNFNDKKDEIIKNIVKTYIDSKYLV